MVGKGLLTVKVCGTEDPPEGAGLVTVTENTPAVAMSPAGIRTTIWIAVIEVGIRAGFVPKLTVAPFVNPLPLIVSMNPAPPASVVVSERLVTIGCALLFVSKKFAGALTPAAPAVTVYAPAVPLAVNTGAVAVPLAPVVAVFTPPANVPLAPLAGAVNVTTAPLTKLFPASLTVACSGTVNAAFVPAV